jgi:hypothetical protein
LVTFFIKYRWQWLMPEVLAICEAEIRRIGGQPMQRVHEAISQITRAKQTGGVAQVLEHLLCKHEALSSKPNPTKNK